MLPPPVALIDTRPEPPGANCVDGGTAVLTGVDRDASGTLDADEIEATSYVCNTPPPGPQPPAIDIDGDLLIRSQAHADRYQQVRTVSGDVTFTGAGPLRLPALERIGGDLVCHDLTGGDVDLPMLVDIGQSLFWSTCDTPRLPRLEAVERNLRIQGRGLPVALPSLREGGVSMSIEQVPGSDLVLPVLTSVEGLEVVGVATLDLPLLATTGWLRADARHVRAPALVEAGILSLGGLLETLELPLLRSSSLVAIEDTPALRSIELPRLTETNDITIRDSALENLHLPALARIGAGLALHNTRVPALHLPIAARAGSLTLTENAVLTSLDVPMLTALLSVTVTDNPQLPACQAEAIADRTGATRTIERNGTGECQP